MRSEARQGDRVGTDMALKVNASKPSDVTQTGKIEANDVAQKLGVCDVSVERVIGGCGVGRGTVIPGGSVDLEIAIHADFSPAAGCPR